MDETQSSYYDELAFVRESDNSIFPDFLFNPVFNDFGDNYYQKSFVTDEMSAIVKRLRRRYNDYFDWLEAMDMYHEYMNMLIEKYGSMSIIKNALKADVLDETVPAKPRLKNNRKNRQFMRAGVVPTKPCMAVPLSKEDVLAIARQAIPGKMGDDVHEEDSYKKMPKKMEKQVRDMLDKIAGKDRRDNLYRSVGSSSGTDFIVEYLNQTKRGIYDSSGNRTSSTDGMTISEIMEENERISMIRPELLDMEDGEQTEIVNSRLVRKKDRVQMEVIKELYSAGYDVFRKLNRTMDKKAVKMIRSQIGATEPLTKKEMKKVRKKARRDAEKIEQRRDNNALLEKTLLGNKIDLRQDEHSLSFRLKDVYRD